MKCPYCHDLENKVIDSRLADDGAAVKRRRECIRCGRRFTTMERASEVLLTVSKRSGGTEPFNREKLSRGIARACEKRDISTDQIDTLVDDVEEELRGKGDTVTSEAIGLLVLSKLRELDDVAYLRFASVYKDFQSASEFGQEVGTLLEKKEEKVKTGKKST